MWMTIRNFWQQAPQSINEIKVGSWVKVGCREGAGRM
jgi:hypothetical protein